jgi:Zn-dependent protease
MAKPVNRSRRGSLDSVLCKYASKKNVVEPRVRPYPASREEESILSSFKPPPEQRRERYWLHLLLFVLTLASTVWAGGTYAGRMLAYETTGLLFVFAGLPVTVGLLMDGLAFGLSLLLFLTVHEFGHYFAARRHGIDTSLPYYIPAPFIGFGTMGAVIRIREYIPSLRKLFDVGAAGPIAGFVVAVIVLLYALSTLPGPDYILGLPGHEPLKAFVEQNGSFPDEMPAPAPSEEGYVIILGPTLLFWFLTQFFPNVPPLYELYHYPVLFAGWLGLFFTALNLLPVGQLDGGHVMYAMLGRTWHRRLARVFVVLLLFSGAVGFMDTSAAWLNEQDAMVGSLSWFILSAILYFFLYRIFQRDHRLIAPVLLGLIMATAVVRAIGDPLTRIGYSGWFVFCLLIVWLIKVDHPPVLDVQPLTPRRKAIGIACLLIFILCFSIRPFYII